MPNLPHPPHYTQYPNVYLDYWLQILSDSAFKILSYLVRRTFGWHKNFYQISLRQIEKDTKKSRPTISKAINELSDHGLVKKCVITSDNGLHDTNFYEIVFKQVPEDQKDTEKEGGGKESLQGGGKESLPPVVKNFNHPPPISPSRVHINTKKKLLKKEGYFSGGCGGESSDKVSPETPHPPPPTLASLESAKKFFSLKQKFDPKYHPQKKTVENFACAIDEIVENGRSREEIDKAFDFVGEQYAKGWTHHFTRSNTALKLKRSISDLVAQSRAPRPGFTLSEKDRERELNREAGRRYRELNNIPEVTPEGFF